MTFEEKIAQTMSQKLDDGTVERIVNEKLTNAIDKTIEDLFRWGDCEKILKEKLKEIMVPTIERHDFSAYITKLDAVLTDIVQTTSIRENKHILECFKQFMSEPKDKIYKLSDIYNMYNEYVKEKIDIEKLEYDCGVAYIETSLEFVEDEYRTRLFISDYDNATVVLSCDGFEDLEYSFKIYKDRNKEQENWTILGKQEIELSSLASISKFELLMIKVNNGYQNIVVDKECISDDIEIPYKENIW